MASKSCLCAVLSLSVMFNSATPWTVCNQPGSSVCGDSPGRNTGVGCHSPLQGDLPNPGIEPRFPVLQVDSLPSEASGKSRILEWVARPFSRGSS